MKKQQFVFSFIISVIFIALKNASWADSLTSFYDHDHLLKIDHEIQNRWKKIEQIKSYFPPYTKKTKEEIMVEFQYLDFFRKCLLYTNPGQSPPRANKDYKIALHLLNRTFFPQYIYLMAFKYNCIGDSYNASTILLYGHHFIALEEPNINTLSAFFKLLLNQNVNILVRLKPEGEYADHGSLAYWKGRLIKGPEYSVIELSNPYSPEVNKTYVPYFYTNLWPDKRGIDVPILYELVQKVKTAYNDQEKISPIACHCSAGVGRTGTFIAAYIIAYLLDVLEPHEISIEEIVLRLSIQRPHMVTKAEQYLVLHQFADYYLEKKKILNKTDKKEF